MYLYKFFLIILSLIISVKAINHFILKDEFIVPKPESPFFLREPNDLAAFLNQIKNEEIIEKSFIQLLRRREVIYEYLKFSVEYGRQLAEQAKCAVRFYNTEKKSSYLRISNVYLKRIGLPSLKSGLHMNNEEPFCEEFAPDVESCFDDHGILEIAPEDYIKMGDAKFEIDTLRRMAVDLLYTEPTLWKSHLLGSYYWRSQGNAQEALNCACRSVTLAPNYVKDIAMQSLGIILFRANFLDDAELVLKGAIEIQPDMAENHFGLGLTLAIKKDFNVSLNHFDEAERLDPSILPKTLPLRNFISCFENINKKTAKMNSYVEFIRKELTEFKALKQQIRRKDEAMMHQQVPLSSRDFINNKDELQKRGQYCSMRKLSLAEDPVLFCDFFSEMQMRLEGQDLDIAALEQELITTTDSIVKQVTKELGTKVDLYTLTGQRNILKKHKISIINRNKFKNIRRS